MFYDLTELKQHANRLYGFSAQKTLDIARALYETYKLISYGSIPGNVSSRSDLRDPGDLIFVRITMIPTAFLIVVWFLIQLLNVGSVATAETGGEAYAAHIAGFFFGTATAPLFEGRRRLAD